MIINDSNKEEVFDGLIRRIYNLEELKAIKAQFDQNPSLLREYQLHKMVIEAAHTVEAEKLRTKLKDYKKELEKEPILRRIGRDYPYAIAASVALLIMSIAALVYLFNRPDTQEVTKAQYLEIPYQEISPNKLGAAGAADTTNRSTLVLLYPDDKAQGYAFRSDTLVLYGKFDPNQLLYRYNTQTLKRTLVVGKEVKTLDYGKEMKSF
jgi:hypothetical protein